MKRLYYFPWIFSCNFLPKENIFGENKIKIEIGGLMY